MGGWRKLHNEDLRDLYFSPRVIIIIKKGGWCGHGRGTRIGYW
jgi:hypothetical protein